MNYDSAWVARRVGVWLQSFFEHDYVIVLDGEDQPLYAVAGDQAMPASALAAIKPQLAPLHRLHARPRAVLGRRHPRRPGDAGRRRRASAGRRHHPPARPAGGDRRRRGRAGQRRAAFARQPRAHHPVGQVHQERSARRHRHAAAHDRSAPARRQGAAARRHRFHARRRARQRDRALCLDAEAAGRRDRAQRHPLHRGGARRLCAARRLRAALHAPHRGRDRGRRNAAAPSRHARPAVRAAQPHLLQRAAGSRDRGGRRRLGAGRGVLHRPRPFQGRQRHARPSDRRRADPQRHAAALAHAARRRPGGAAGRRRVRGDLGDRRRPRTDDDDRAAHDRRDLRALLDRRPEHRRSAPRSASR